ncbi:beta-glucosidase BglX [Chthonobacter rhizosphaerae]|uniref:beta-glucosidase BglX n=1 Tax=Chthonobacter rhizosphaerae TaxID=2735553 RepID=UPI0015EEFD3A|nr:beta-glucosidase BglX [Chthonobacter rhizosphaerae]
MTETEFLDDLLARMTLAEKIGQLNLVTPGGDTATGAVVNTGVADKVRAGRIGSVFGVKSLAAVRGFQDLALQSRLRIPLMFAEDVIHGHRTIFPLPIALAAAFDPALVRRTARVAADEASACGIDQVYAPMVDVCRDPRWGRIAESPGEDPYLASRYAAAMVEGLQGEGIDRPDSVMACLKHFVAYGAPLGGRDYAGADMSPARLHDVYLPPFRAGLAAGAGSVMAGFNTLNGVPMHAHRRLLAGLLRERLRFDGLVVADYTGVAELMAHRVAETGADAARTALEAGVDLDMVSELFVATLAAEVRAGRVAEADVDGACRRVLAAKWRLGLFADPFRRIDRAPAGDRLLTRANRRLARKAVAETCVLLKNAGPVLPLSGRGVLALVGPLADDRVNMSGTWAVNNRPADVVPIRAGLAAVAGPGLAIRHAKGCNIVDDPVLAARLNVHDGHEKSVTIDDRTPERMIEEAVAVARGADVVVAVVGEAKEYSGESSSRVDLRLPAGQRRLLEALRAAGPPLVVVVMTGRPLILHEEAALADALMIAWFPGTEAGHGLADVLIGEAEPSGRLPVSLPFHEGQIPVAYAEPPTGRPFRGRFEKFRTGYVDMPDGFSHDGGVHPFGFGLSYTRFAYGTVRTDRLSVSPGGRLRVEVPLRNVGSRTGSDVVQLYVQAPAGPVSRPVLELKRFAKVTLRPEEERLVVFELTEDDLAASTAETIEDTGRRAQSGLWRIYVGPNARALDSVTVDWRTGPAPALPADAPGRS